MNFSKIIVFFIFFEEGSSIPAYLYSSSHESNSLKSSVDEQFNSYENVYEGIAQDVESTTTSTAETYDDIPISEETIIASGKFIL